MNKILLIGRITKDPEIQGGEGKEVTHFTLAVDRPMAKEGQQQADFIGCVAFGKTAKFLGDYVKKGYRLAIEGRVATGSYQNAEGKTVYTTDVIIERLENLTPKGNTEAPKDKATKPAETPTPTTIDVSDDDLPF